MADGTFLVNKPVESYTKYYLSNDPKSLKYIFAKEGNVISIYIYELNNLSEVTSVTSAEYPKNISANLGTIASPYRPGLANNAGYVLMPVYSSATPYLQVGSIWISTDTGTMTLYAKVNSAKDKPSYSFGTYVAAY